MKLLAIKLVNYLLAYIIGSLLVTVIYSGAMIIMCGVKDWRFLAQNALKCLIVPFLFGAPIDSDLLIVFLLVFNYIGFPYSATQEMSLKEKFIIFAALLATSQLPLDWDLETPYQFYPWPILIALEVSHTLTLLIK